MNTKKGFTLIELLVVIGIIAILAVVVVLALNPIELLKQSRDGRRVSDLNTINKSAALYYSDALSNPGTLFMGSSSVMYISVPDPSATSSAGDQCQGLALPPLASGWTYHCAANSTYQRPDGTGWIPINFNANPEGTPISSLPTDPINTAGCGHYYRYATNGVDYETAGSMESQKYSPTEMSDGGENAGLYEKGTAFSVLPPNPSLQAESSTAEFVNGGSYPNISAQFDCNVASGDAIIITIQYNTPDGSDYITGCSDTNNPTSAYKKAVSSYNISTGSHQGVDIWYALNVAGGTNPTVTCTFSSINDASEMIVQEYSGLATTNALDATSSYQSGLSQFTSWTTGTSTTQSNGELVLGAFVATYNSGALPSPIVPSAGLTDEVNVPDNGMTTVDVTQGTAGPISITGNSSGAQAQANVMATFRKL